MIFLGVFFVRDVLVSKKKEKHMKSTRNNSNLLIGTSLMNDQVNPDNKVSSLNDEEKKMEFDDFMKKNRKKSAEDLNISGDMGSDLNSSRSSSRSGGGVKRNRKTLRKELGYGDNNNDFDDQDYNY